MNTVCSNRDVLTPRANPGPREEKVFGRHARLRTDSAISRMKRSGRTVAGRYCVVSTLCPPPDERRRVGFIISRRYSPKAVVRNRARRVLREAYRQLCPQLRVAWIALIPRHHLKKAKSWQVAEDIKRACSELGIVGTTARSE